MRTMNVTYQGCTVQFTEAALLHFQRTGEDVGAWIVSFKRASSAA